MSSSSKFTSHSDYCQKVCLLCFSSKKAKEKSRIRFINDKQWDLIERFVISGLDRHDSRLPTVLCETCNRVLTEYGRGVFNRKIQLFDHSRITAGTPMVTREHTCLVCEIGSSMFGKCQVLKPKVGRPLQNMNMNNNIVPTPIKLCSFCFTEISQGKNHICTNTTKETNILKSLQGSDKSSEKIAAAVLQTKFKSSVNKENYIDLIQSSGRHMNVKIFKKDTERKRKTVITHDDMLTIKSSLGLSGRSTLELAKDLRSASSNRQFVQPHMKQCLSEHIHKLDDFYCVEQLTDLSVPVVYCKNIRECLQLVVQERSISLNDSELKIGIDAGGGFLKVCVNVMVQEENSARKRLCYGDGISSKKFKSTSVRKLIILAIAPGLKENHASLSKVLGLLKLDELPPSPTVRYAADLKMVNLLLGLMSAASSHPCSWCDIDR